LVASTATETGYYATAALRPEAETFPIPLGLVDPEVDLHAYLTPF